MYKPTNELYSHGIATDSNAKNIRISLTFRQLLPKSSSAHVMPPLKKPKLILEEPCTHPELTIDECSLDTFPSTPPLPQQDWLTQLFQTMDKPSPLLSRFSLEWGTFVDVVLEKNAVVRLHIRHFKESADGQFYHTKQGIIMTCSTWSDFITKIQNFKFHSTKNSFVSNNQLLTAFIDEEYCHMQQIFRETSNEFYFKSNGISLSKDMFFKLNELTLNITECLIETILTKAIPNLILNKSPVCILHVESEEAKNNYLNCLKKEIESCIEKLFECASCFEGYNSPFQHDCLMFSSFEKFSFNRQSILLNINPFNVAKAIFNEGCTCHYTTEFLNQFDVSSIETYVENVFKKNM